MVFTKPEVRSKEISAKTKEFVSKKSVQTTAVSAIGGATAVGIGGAVTGVTTGALAGAAAGLPLALFTFGLSIPFGAALGGGAGLVVGTTAGTTAGAVGGGAAGYGAYQHRAAIRRAAGAVVAKARSAKAAGMQRVTKLNELVIAAYASAKQQGCRTLSNAKAKAKDTAAKTKEFTSKKSVQTTAVSAVGGATVVGTGGALTGATTGALAGAAAGLPLALFTFGLSIPFGAVLGGGAGLVVGTTVGTTTGALGGGATGYGAYQHRAEIRSAAGAVAAKAISSAEFVEGKGKEVASATRTRLYETYPSAVVPSFA